MSLLYITGSPGAGKTTLQRELQAKGYDTRDIDSPDFGGPFNKSTNQRVIIPPADQRSPDWFDAHEWRVFHDAFEELKRQSKDSDIIVCGVAASDDEIIHVFDTIMYLALSDEVLLDRLTSRVDNDYGKNDFEAREILERKHGLDAKYASSRVIKIDANQSLADTVRQIESHL
jgi:adenylate kinase family enzyme